MGLKPIPHSTCLASPCSLAPTTPRPLAPVVPCPFFRPTLYSWQKHPDQRSRVSSTPTGVESCRRLLKIPPSRPPSKTQPHSHFVRLSLLIHSPLGGDAKLVRDSLYQAAVHEGFDDIADQLPQDLLFGRWASSLVRSPFFVPFQIRC